jgi:hypothetical protein
MEPKVQLANRAVCRDNASESSVLTIHMLSRNLSLSTAVRCGAGDALFSPLGGEHGTRKCSSAYLDFKNNLQVFMLRF